MQRLRTYLFTDYKRTSQSPGHARDVNYRSAAWWSDAHFFCCLHCVISRNFLHIFENYHYASKTQFHDQQYKHKKAESFVNGLPKFKTNIPTADLQQCVFMHFWIFSNRTYRFDAKSIKAQNR